jgi:hypothetical protein
MTVTKPLILLAASTLLLVGCTAGPTTTDSGDGGDTGGGTIAKGVPCEENTSGVELFSDASISESPEYGQVWGDGSPLVIAYDDFTNGTLGYDISYVQDDGAVIPVTGGFFPDPEGTTFTSNDLLFNSASDGYYGIIDVQVTTDDLTTTALGAYCVVLAISE